MVNKSEFKHNSPTSFLGTGNMNLLFNSDIVNLLLKTNVGRERRTNVAILDCFNCWWEGGEVGGSWFYSWVGNAGWVQDFVFLFLLIKGTKRQDMFKIFLHSLFQGWEKQAKWLSCVVSTYLYNAFDCMFLSCQVSLNGWVFVYELSGCGFKSSCSHLNFRFRACFEQGVPWHSGSYRVWIHSETHTWHDKKTYN